MERNKSRSHIGSKNLLLFESLMHAIYLLKEFWYQAYLWERPEGGGRNMRAAQCLGVLQEITMSKLMLDERFIIVKTCF